MTNDPSDQNETLDDLHTLALSIPSMGGHKIARHLREAAEKVPEGSCIVEVGAWLGAGTAQLALGAKKASPVPKIHVFDRFHASRSEVVKADKGGISLKKGQSTLPLVQENLARFDAQIEYYQGSIEDIVWTGGPIGLYVDDAAKVPSSFYAVLKAFGPSWIPGVTTLILMDYGYWKRHQNDPARATELRVQHDFVTGNPETFSVINEGPIAGTSAAIIRYERAFDFSTVPTVSRKKPTFLSRLFKKKA